MLGTGKTTCRVLHPVLGSSVQESHGATGKSPTKTAKMLKRLEHLSHKKMLGELGVWSGEEKTLGGFNQCIIYLKGGCKKERPRLLSVVSSDSSRGNGHKMKYGKFLSERQETLFYCAGD